MKNPLNDKDFLKQLDLEKNKETYVKILNLNFNEEVRESIEGKVVSGSINIDGASAVRRTCSLSMVADEININDYLWGLHTKIQIFIGLKNNINPEYEDVIWFNQGIYILTSFNISYNTSSYTINLSGQDKMCMLNGSIGGTLPASIDFKQEVINTKIYEKVDLGPTFIPDIYKTVRSFHMSLDTEQSITADRRYFRKTFNDYQPVQITDETTFKSFDELYIANDEVYREIDLDKYYDMIEQAITLFKLATNDDEEKTYVPINISNDNTAPEENEQYYVDNSYREVQEAESFDEFEQYYIRNERGRLSPIFLDEDGFIEQKSDGLYVSNHYKKIDSFNENIEEYFQKVGGKYTQTSLTPISYKPNTFYYKSAISYAAAGQEFDPTAEYYTLDGTYVDFYEKAYNSYQSNKYYIKNIYEDDYILYPGEYDPTLEYYEQKVYSDKKDIPIKTIIKEAVHTYGREPYYNIIINDVDDEGLLLKEYVGENPLYLLVDNGICENITNEEQECYVIGRDVDLDTINLYSSLIQDELALLYDEYASSDNPDKAAYDNARENLFNILIQGVQATQTTIGNNDNIIYNSFIEDFDKNLSKVFFITDNTKEIKIYTVLKLQKGDAAGYELTDLTYPYDLISSPGEALTSVLDKIKDVLQNFEYFYDVDGHFIFQRKKTYLNTSWNNIITTEDQTYVTSAADTSAVQYTFEDNDLIISIGNNIRLDNLKNDYSVWGTRKTINDVEVPIHARFAIDQKPYVYTTFPRTKYNYVDNSDKLKTYSINGLEYLYQDVYINKDFSHQVLNITNPYGAIDFNKVRVEPTQYQGTMYAGKYFNYIECDWREIIYQMALDYYKHNQENDFLANLSHYNTYDTTEYFDNDNEFVKVVSRNGGLLYPNGITGYEQYYEDMEGFWRQLYNPEPEVDVGHSGGYYYNKEWQTVMEDYSKFHCDYYLPLEDYDQYAELLNQAIQDLQAKVDELSKQIESYPDENKDLKELLDQLDGLKKQLAELQQQKSDLMKRYYTQRLFTFNDPEYKKMQQQYSKIEQEKNNLIKNTEEQILSILRDSFELF